MAGPLIANGSAELLDFGVAQREPGEDRPAGRVGDRRERDGERVDGHRLHPFGARTDS